MDSPAQPQPAVEKPIHGMPIGKYNAIPKVQRAEKPSVRKKLAQKMAAIKMREEKRRNHSIGKGFKVVQNVSRVR